MTGWGGERVVWGAGKVVRRWGGERVGWRGKKRCVGIIKDVHE